MSKKSNPQKVVFFIIKRRVVLLKTTGCFTKNDGSFYQKRRVVLSKTTACFTKNDRLFYQKRRLVLPKTTGCFIKNDGSFYQKRQVVSIRRKTSAEAFAVISPRAHTLFCSSISLHKAKIAQIQPICAEINLIIRNKTLTLPNLLRVF